MTRVNMSYADRWIRLGLVAVMAILLFTGTLSGWSAVVVGVIAYGFLVSSLTGFCPLYVPVRINTDRRR